MKNEIILWRGKNNGDEIWYRIFYGSLALGGLLVIAAIVCYFIIL